MKRRRPGRAAISVDFSYPRLRRGSKSRDTAIREVGNRVGVRVANSVPPLLIKAIAEHISHRFFISQSSARQSATFDPAQIEFGDLPDGDSGELETSIPGY